VAFGPDRALWVVRCVVGQIGEQLLADGLTLVTNLSCSAGSAWTRGERDGHHLLPRLNAGSTARGEERYLRAVDRVVRARQPEERRERLSEPDRAKAAKVIAGDLAADSGAHDV
jgi:hypothetical protein